MDTVSVPKTPSTPVAAPPSRSIGKIWADLTTPAAGLSLSDQQKARLLAAVTLVFTPVALFAIFISPVATMLRGEQASLPSPVLFLTIGLIFFAYILSRTTNYQWGALLIVAIPFFAAGGTVLTTQSEFIGLSVHFFMALGITFASLLMGARETIIAGVVSVVLIIVLSPIKSETGLVEWAAVSFSLVITVTSSLVSSVRDRNLHALEASQEELRQQVIETTEARERAERSDKVKSAFLASMSHELRTPLNAIINFTRYVAKGSLGPVNEEQAETLGEVVDSAKHLLNLINDVLDMSKIEAGSLNLFVEEDVNVKAILENVVSTGRSLLTDKQVEIVLNAPDDLPNIRADRQRILQIFLNIMSNACKFTEQGKIDVTARRSGSEIVFSIKDTGPGINTTDQASVFEAFKQTTTGLRQGGGTGLGMPISKSLAEAHGGRMWLESVPQQGATFFVALPVKSETLTPALNS